MATNLCPALLRSFARPFNLGQGASLRRIPRALYSTDAPSSPPFLSVLRNDLKKAMKAKDTNRLSVLRAVLASTTNASKTTKPIQTDMQLVDLLGKHVKNSQLAADEARGAGRRDLVEKEEAQRRILEEYIGRSGLDEIPEPHLREIVETARTALLAENGGPIKDKALPGKLIQRLFGSGGPLDGALVSRETVVKVVMELSKHPDAPKQDSKA